MHYLRDGEPVFKDLLHRESQIWGSTDHASPVRVEVLNAILGTAAPAKRSEYGQPVFEQPAYALFPAQSKEGASIYRNGSFELRISVPKSKLSDLGDDVDAAIRHWISFGGVGARTRRGVGALYCDSSEYSGEQNYLNPRDLLGDGQTREWSILKGARLVMGQVRPWKEAWIAAINLLQLYRQRRFRPQGRSTWPEPDAVRRLRRQRAAHHSEDLSHENAIPRAAFGLPMIFHFKTPGDPADQELVIDSQTDRMASPIILKPMAINQTEARPILLALNTPIPERLTLQQGRASDLTVHRGNRDVISELIAQAAEQWKTEVIGL